ncbi:GNAT family N-acetyltransferase [Nocardioides sp. NPDC059952]|uniref:GNAT family N-acetyltransferase n=1 Tax=Nocardioides sp. NPDC059952 TaxID=3347014 RepID=UPI0036633145
MPADDVSIRAVDAADLPELVELIRDHARYERAADPRPDLQTALAAWLFVPRPQLHVLVAVQGDALVGYASWSLEASTWQAAEYAHLDCLFLRESVRGRGAGHLLMRAVEAEARAVGAGELQWQTPEWNDRAIRFYRRTGAYEAAKARFTLPLTGPSRT